MADFRLNYTGEQTNQTLKESIEQKTEIGQVKTNITQLQSDVLNKINKGTLATINGQNLENGGNIEINGKSVFDITPYFIDQTHISVEGYNLLRSGIEKGEISLVSANLTGTPIYLFIKDVVATSITLYWFIPYEEQHLHAIVLFEVTNTGDVIKTAESGIPVVQANPAGLTNRGELNTIGIGNWEYEIPKYKVLDITSFLTSSTSGAISQDVYNQLINGEYKAVKINAQGVSTEAILSYVDNRQMIFVSTNYGIHLITIKPDLSISIMTQTLIKSLNYDNNSKVLSINNTEEIPENILSVNTINGVSVLNEPNVPSRNIVEANPTTSGTTDLTSIKLGNTVYNIPSSGKLNQGTINGNSVFAPSSFNLTLPTSNDLQVQANKITQLEATHEAINTQLSNKINSSEKGTANGVATLDKNTKIPSSQLPSYVDDVVEFANRNAFPQTGESGKIYIDLATNKTYRWGGSTYVVIGSDLALGTTSSTAYAGDKGAKNASDIADLKANKQDKMYVGVINGAMLDVYSKLTTLINDSRPIVIFDRLEPAGDLYLGEMIATTAGDNDLYYVCYRGVWYSLDTNGKLELAQNYITDATSLISPTYTLTENGLKIIQMMISGEYPSKIKYNEGVFELNAIDNVSNIVMFVSTVAPFSTTLEVKLDTTTPVKFNIKWLAEQFPLLNAKTNNDLNHVIYDDAGQTGQSYFLPYKVASTTSSDIVANTIPYVENGVYKQLQAHYVNSLTTKEVKQYFGGIVDLTNKANCTQEEYDKLANGNYVVKKDGNILSLTSASASQLIFESKKTKLTIDATNKTIVSSIIQQASETYTKFNATLDGGKSTNISLLEMKQAEFIVNIATADTPVTHAIHFKLGVQNIYTQNIPTENTSKEIYLKLSFFGNQVVAEYGITENGQITTTKKYLNGVQPILTIDYNDELSGGAIINGWGAK